MSAIEGELIHNHYLSSSTESHNGTKNSMDFIGFTFGGKHSTELGINRVSNGSRYTETLLPEFSNKTVNVPGANRVDYLGMEYTQKSFPLDIAFDSVTEEQLREMRRLFSTDKPLPLVFDESPYKTYYAKAGGNPSFTYVCFDEERQREDYQKEFEREKSIYLFPFYYETNKEINFELEFYYNDTQYFLRDSFLWNEDLKNFYFNLGRLERLQIQIKPTSYNHLIFYFFRTNDFNEKKEETEFLDIKIKISTKILERVYKGEGKIDLISFYPYSFCDPNFLKDFPYDNQQWMLASGLQRNISKNKVYNPGDYEAPFSVLFEKKHDFSQILQGEVSSNSNPSKIEMESELNLSIGSCHYFSYLSSFLGGHEILNKDEVIIEMVDIPNEENKYPGFKIKFKNAPPSDDDLIFIFYYKEKNYYLYSHYVSTDQVFHRNGDIISFYEKQYTPEFPSGYCELNDKRLQWSSILTKDEDCYLRFNGKNELIEGLDRNKKITGNIYNHFISSGNWFTIPVNLPPTDFFVSTVDELPYTIDYKILYI